MGIKMVFMNKVVENGIILRNKARVITTYKTLEIEIVHL